MSNQNQTTVLDHPDKVALLQAALDDMTPDELTQLEERVAATRARMLGRARVFDLSFQATSDPRKGTPYVARLWWSVDRRLSSGEKIPGVERTFFDLRKTWGKKTVTVGGTYQASPGQIIERREGGSWNNDYRDWYLVQDDGTLRKLCSASDSQGTFTVGRYLAGELSQDEMLIALHLAAPAATS